MRRLNGYGVPNRALECSRICTIKHMCVYINERSLCTPRFLDDWEIHVIQTANGIIFCAAIIAIDYIIHT